MLKFESKQIQIDTKIFKVYIHVNDMYLTNDILDFEMTKHGNKKKATQSDCLF